MLCKQAGFRGLLANENRSYNSVSDMTRTTSFHGRPYSSTPDPAVSATLRADGDRTVARIVGAEQRRSLDEMPNSGKGSV